MNRLVFSLLIFTICQVSLAKNVKVELEGLPNPVSCSEEVSIQGFFCLNGEEYLIIRSFGDSYIAFGNLADLAKDKNFTVSKIEDSEGKLLYQSNLGNIPGLGSYVGNLNFTPYIPPESLATDYSLLLLIESNLNQPSFNDEKIQERSKTFERFLQKKLAEISKRKNEILRKFHSGQLTISLEDGTEVNCTRGESREKDDFDRGIEKVSGGTVVCGMLKCGRDNSGNERLLFLHYEPGHGFANILYSNKNGFSDGPKVRSVKSEGSATPLIAYDHSNSIHQGFYEYEMPEISQDNFVPEGLRGQSNFFKHWNMPNYEIMLRDSGRLCKDDSWKSFNNALNAFEEKVTNAQLVQYITVVNNILTGYYLPLDQVPSGACNQDGVFYNPQAYGKTLPLSPTLNKQAISLDKAKELFEYSKNMIDIAWDYKQDGCYARAHLMARRFEAMGINVDKAWLKGELALKQDDGMLIEWNFHVAPVVYVENNEGKVEKFIIDPSTFDKPVKVSEWSEKLTKSNKRPQTTRFPFPQNSSMFNRNSIAFSNSSPYLADDISNLSEDEKLRLANETMTRYLGYNHE